MKPALAPARGGSPFPFFSALGDASASTKAPPPRLALEVRVRLAFALFLLLGNSAIYSAETVMTYIYHAPESSLDKRYLYHWEILRTALEKTKDQYGPYPMEPSDVMSQKRPAFEL